MDKTLLSILVCPVCKGKVQHKGNELICPLDRMAFPIRDQIPVMLESEARHLSLDEKEQL